MKITGIKKNEHGFADYTYVPAVMAAPYVAGFTNNKTAANLCKAFSLTVLGYSLFTDANWGAVKIIPYKVHAALDLSVGILSFAATGLPTVAKDRKARNTFIAMGITGLVVGALSLIGAEHTIDKVSE